MKLSFSLVVMGAVLSAPAWALMEPATPESQGVASAAIAKWIDAEAKLDSVHSFVLVRHGKVIAQGAWAPYDLDRPHQLYSHSKSFTSTAVGFLVDDGRLDLDQRLVEFFPDKFPADADPKVRALRVRDLLTMNTGFDGSDTMRAHPEEPDWLKSFFATKPGVWPGTRFRYDTCATHVLAAVVEKVAGQPIMAFLQARLCRPLGMGRIYTHVAPSGIGCGGYGMYARTPDLAKFGQLYLTEGVWDGQRILSRDWVRLATAKQTMCGFVAPGAQPTDWSSGYGFQFWRCRHNCYRADGSHGQYTVVMPDQDAVLSVTSCLPDMGKILDITWRLLLPEMKPAPLPENAAASAALAKKCRELTLPVVAGQPTAVRRLPTVTFDLAKNPRGYRQLRLEETDNGQVCHLLIDAVGEQTFRVGSGEWAEGAIFVCEKDKAYEGMGDLLGEQPVCASGAWRDETHYRIRLLFIDQAHRLDLDFICAEGKWNLKGNHVGLGGCGFAAEAVADLL